MINKNNKGISRRGFLIIKIITAIMIAITASQSIITRNFILPILTIAAGLLILLYFKSKVTEVMEDERDYEAGGTAARWAIQIYGILAVVAMFILYAYQDINPFYETVAATLAYSVCFLLLIYSIIFHYYERAKFFEWKKSYVFLAVAAAVLIILAGIRIFSGEDDWICKGGEWAKHGNPDFPAPTVPCKK